MMYSFLLLVVQAYGLNTKEFPNNAFCDDIDGYRALTETECKKFGDNTAGITWATEANTSNFPSTCFMDLRYYSIFFNVSNIASVYSGYPLVCAEDSTPSPTLSCSAYSEQYCPSQYCKWLNDLGECVSTSFTYSPTSSPTYSPTSIPTMPCAAFTEEYCPSYCKWANDECDFTYSPTQSPTLAPTLDVKYLVVENGSSCTSGYWIMDNEADCRQFTSEDTTGDYTYDRKGDWVNRSSGCILRLDNNQVYFNEDKDGFYNPAFALVCIYKGVV